MTLTPKQASDENRNAFFAWLDAQKQAENVEKARKLAEAEAEKKRKEQEAKARRMETERRDLTTRVSKPPETETNLSGYI